MPHELVTIRFSHYCEKARWALDRFAVPYVEHGYVPTFHFPAVMRRALPARAGRRDAVSTRFSTPMLRTADGRLLTDSSDIVAWVDARYAGGALYRPRDAAELERELGLELGPHSRRLGYFAVLPDRALVVEMADRNVSRAQALAFRLVSPLAAPVLRRLLRVDAAGAARSEAKVRRVADRIGARIADGRPYLCGDVFCAADLAFAALFAPVVLPPEYGAWLPPLERLSERIEPLVREMRAHPAGRLALRLYREERSLVARASDPPSSTARTGTRGT